MEAGRLPPARFSVLTIRSQSAVCSHPLPPTPASAEQASLGEKVQRKRRKVTVWLRYIWTRHKAEASVPTCDILWEFWHVNPNQQLSLIMLPALEMP